MICIECAKTHTCAACHAPASGHYARYCTAHRYQRICPTARALGRDGEFPYICRLPRGHSNPHVLIATRDLSEQPAPTDRS